MNILFLTFNFSTSKEAGIPRPWETAQLLKSLGHIVTVITAGTHYMTGEGIRKDRRKFWSKEIIEDIKVYKTCSLKHHRKSLYKRILNYTIYAIVSLIIGLFHCWKPDIILIGTDDVMTIIPVGFLLCKIYKASIILDVRDVYPDTLVALGYLKNKNLIRIISKWQKFFFLNSSKIIAATPGIRQILIRKGIEENKIFVFPSAFLQEEKNLPADFINYFKRYGWNSKFIILYTGALGRATNIRTIIDAAEIVQNQNRDISFIFIGEGEKKKFYLQICRNKKIDNCYFMPIQPREFIPFFIKSANVCIHSFNSNSFWRCALSNKIFDYLANGRPVVFAGKGDIKELLKKAKAGISVKPENPHALAEIIIYLYKNPQLRKKMGENGRSYVLSHFSRKIMTQKLLQVISK